MVLIFDMSFSLVGAPSPSVSVTSRDVSDSTLAQVRVRGRTSDPEDVYAEDEDEEQVDIVDDPERDCSIPGACSCFCFGASAETGVTGEDNANAERYTVPSS